MSRLMLYQAIEFNPRKQVDINFMMLQTFIPLIRFLIYCI